MAPKRYDNWSDVHREICNSEVHIAGKKFEDFTKEYFKVIHAGEYKNIWMFEEVPEYVREHLNLGTVDHGIDIIIQDNNDKYIAVQCKFKYDQHKVIRWTADRLANMLADGDKCDYYIVFTNGIGVDNYTYRKYGDRLFIYTKEDLENLSKKQITRIVYPKIKRKKAVDIKPRSRQKKAIKKVTTAFKKDDRCQMIYPCGFGKTWTSIWIKEAMKSKKTLILVPSLQLLKQFMDDWRVVREKPIPYICACSEKDIDRGFKKQTNILSDVKAMGNVTTDAIELKKFMKSHKEYIVVSTYQSFPKVCDATKKARPFLTFDLAICDEAHLIAGDKKGLFTKCLDNKNCRIRKRLFMTATPKVLSDSLKATDTCKYVADMDDESLFGSVVDYMSFGEAIAEKILSDYQILVTYVDNSEVEEWIRTRQVVDDDGTTIEQVANVIALEKVREEYGIKKTIAYHSSIARSKKFSEIYCDMYEGCSVCHMDGGMSAFNRKLKINDFVDDDYAILSNSRVLQVGVNIESVDSIMFCDSKNSVIDIVQSIGRALRLFPGKENSYIIVPVMVNEDVDIEETMYSAIAKVLRAMASHDERIEAEITKFVTGLGTRRPRPNQVDFAEFETIKMVGFEKQLYNSIFNKCVTKSLKVYIPLENLKKIAKKHNIKTVTQWREAKLWWEYENVPSHPDTVYDEWIGWRDFFDKNYLSWENLKKLVKDNNIKSRTQWREAKLWKEHENVPSPPDTVYDEWIGWEDFFDKPKRYGKRNYLSWENLKKIAKDNNIKSSGDWVRKKLWKTHENVPSNPNTVYNEWINWPEFIKEIQC